MFQIYTRNIILFILLQINNFSFVVYFFTSTKLALDDYYKSVSSDMQKRELLVCPCVCVCLALCVQTTTGCPLNDVWEDELIEMIIKMEIIRQVLAISLSHTHTHTHTRTHTHTQTHKHARIKHPLSRPFHGFYLPPFLWPFLFPGV